MFDKTTKESVGKIRRKDNLGISQYQAGQYVKAISNISAALRQDTALQIRIMNFIDPQFQSLAASYLAIKDTAGAVNTYREWSKFSYNADAASQAGLLSLLSGNKAEAKEWALKAADMHRKGREPAPLALLSILEIFVVNGIHDSARNFTATIDTSRLNKEQKILMEYLLQVDRITSNTSSTEDLRLLLAKIEGLSEKEETWSYEFFELWLNNAGLKKEQQLQIRRLTDAIQEKIHS